MEEERKIKIKKITIINRFEFLSFTKVSSISIYNSIVNFEES